MPAVLPGLLNVYIYGLKFVFDFLARDQHLTNFGSEPCHFPQVALPFHQRGYHSVCAHAEAAATLDRSADRVSVGT